MTSTSTLECPLCPPGTKPFKRTGFAVHASKKHSVGQFASSYLNFGLGRRVGLRELWKAYTDAHPQMAATVGHEWDEDSKDLVHGFVIAQLRWDYAIGLKDDGPPESPINVYGIGLKDTRQIDADMRIAEVNVIVVAMWLMGRLSGDMSAFVTKIAKSTPGGRGFYSRVVESLGVEAMNDSEIRSALEAVALEMGTGDA